MMASSQVEIASSNSFGCILRNQSRHRETNLKGLGRDSLHARISVSQDSTSDDNGPPTLRQSINHDKWAHEMVSTIELVGPPSTSLSEPSSPCLSTNQVSAPNRGASSLVQIWEARLGRSTSMNNRNNNNNDVATELTVTTVNSVSRSSSSNSSSSNCNFPMSNNERTGSNDELPSQFESQGDRDSDQTTLNGLEPTLRPSQRPKIADLIRKLMATNPSNSKKTTNCDREKYSVRESSPSRDQDRHQQHDHCVGPDHPNITHSLRLRGRQAFNDVLLMMECGMKDELEKLGERKAVSGFSKKGRIQSLLRLKILQRGLSLQDGWRPHSGSAKPNHDNHGSTVHLRENWTTATDQTVPPKCDDDIGSSSYLSGQSSIISHIEAQQNHPESSCTMISIPTEDVREELSLASNATYQDHTSTEEANFPEPTESNDGWYQEWPLEGEEGDDEQQVIHGDRESMEALEDTGSERFLGVARPRSYWEDLRKAWYGQMLMADSANNEICQLLQRRTVSNVLTTESNFRDRMNNLMISHVEKWSHRRVNENEEDQSQMSGLETMRRFLSSYLRQQSQSLQNGSHEAEDEEVREEEHLVDEANEEEHGDEDEEEDEEMYLRRQERMQELMSNRLQVLHADSISSQGDEDEGGEVIDENTYGREDHDDGTIEDIESIVTQRYHDEPIEIFHQSTSLTSTPSQSSPIRNNDDDHQVISRNPHNVISYHQDAFSSGGRISMEMELKNELRGQMKQLYQEISELRRSISNCIDVQVKFQDSIKQEIMTFREGWRRTEERGSRKGYCCICYDMKVNSLLYRCGHMCTCLECARELQLGSGKCPICRALIVDVVRAYTES